MDHLPTLRNDLKIALVKYCRLSTRLQPEDIGDEVNFFDGGLGLDSIDILEMIVHVEKHYGLKLRNTPDGREALQTIATLADAIVAQQAAPSSGAEAVPGKTL